MPDPAIPRSIGRDGAGASIIQLHLTQAFNSDHTDHFQGVGDQFQLLRDDFSEVLHTVAAFQTAGFRRLHSVYLAGKVFW